MYGASVTYVSAVVAGVLAGDGPDDLEPVGSAPRKGFETTITLRTEEPHVAVRARDGSGRVLGASEALKIGD